MATGSNTRGGSAARNVKIPPTGASQLATALNWVDVASGGRLGNQIVQAAIRHHRSRHTEPGILIAAAIQYLVSDSDRKPDRVNRFWHLVDQVSARERSRYLNMEESELM